MNKALTGNFNKRLVMVPVLDQNNVPLMPCSEKRARQLMEKEKAKPYWQKGIFCVKMLVEPSARNYQDVVLGIDPGSKREGYTVATKNAVVLNITTNTPSWVKGNVETRRTLRKSRRGRKTPYRKCRSNRSASKKDNRIAPSTKARWNAKLRMIAVLMKILPINMINVEDVKAITKPGKRRWNRSFSPLEVGKKYFYETIGTLGVKLILTHGFETSNTRKLRLLNDSRFSKSKDKKDYGWNSHCVDSHILSEIALNKCVEPFMKTIKIEWFQFIRRQLHRMVPKKGGERDRYGSTITNGVPKGSVCKYIGTKKSKAMNQKEFYYLGGSMDKSVSLHLLSDGNRITQNAKLKDLKFFYIGKYKIYTA